MRDQLTEELISAYLDGELSADETARVEEALDQSAECRELYEDLKGLRSSLQALPRFSLPDDFPDRVVRQAERESLSPTPAPPTVLPAAKEGAKQLRAWQMAAITAAVVAAALLFALVVVSQQSAFRPPGQPIVPSDQFVENEGPREIRGPESAAPDGLAFTNDQVEPTTYVFVIDLAITAEGQRVKVFEDALKKAGIGFDPSIRVHQQLEEALLANRYLGDVQRLPLEAEEEERADGDAIEMVYVTGSGSEIESAISDLQSRPGEHIARVQFDMAIEPNERMLFRQLNDTIRLASSSSDGAPRARRLVFRFALRTSTSFLAAMPTPTIQTELLPESEPPAQTDVPLTSFLETPDVADSADPLMVGQPRAQLNEEPKILFEVLFILRNLNPPAE
jgi:negative regulator of sigma E activity